MTERNPDSIPKKTIRGQCKMNTHPKPVKSTRALFQLPFGRVPQHPAHSLIVIDIAQKSLQVSTTTHPAFPAGF